MKSVGLLTEQGIDLGPYLHSLTGQARESLTRAPGEGGTALSIESQFIEQHWHPGVKQTCSAFLITDTKVKGLLEREWKVKTGLKQCMTEREPKP